MKLSDFLKSPSSFRAQMVAFIALMLMLTMAVIIYYNQRLEDRLRQIWFYAPWIIRHIFMTWSNRRISTD